MFEFRVDTRIGYVFSSQINGRPVRLSTEQVENFALVQAIERPQA